MAPDVRGRFPRIAVDDHAVDLGFASLRVRHGD